MTISTALLVAACILLILAAMGVPTGRLSLMAAGLACWVLAIILERV